jgi:hypothetical protein
MRKRLFEERTAIRFGPVALEHDGLRYGRWLLPWNEADFVWAEEGLIRVRKRGKVFDWCAVKMEKVPNGGLLLALVKERIDKAEATAP